MTGSSMSSFLGGIAGMSLLATLAAAAPQVQPFIYAWPPELPSPGPGARTISARLIGNECHDAIVIANGVAVAYFEPAVGEASTVIPFTGFIRDAATLRSELQATPLYRDELVLAAADGLWLAGFNEGEFEAVAIDTSSYWSGVHRLHVVDLDRDGWGDILALLADGHTIASKRQWADGTFHDYNRAGFVTTSDVFDLDLAQLEPASLPPELALVEASGLTLRRLNGYTIASHATLLAGADAMAVLHDVDGTDRVLWSTPVTSDSTDVRRNLYVVDAATSTFQAQTSRGICTLAAGALSDNALDDVALGLRHEEEALLLYSQDSGSTRFDFAAANYETLFLLPIGTGDFDPAVPLVQDLSNDHADDLLMPVATSNEVRFYPGSFRDDGYQAQGPPWLGEPDFVHGSASVNVDWDDPDTTGPGMVEHLRVLMVKARFPGIRQLPAGWSIEHREFHKPPAALVLDLDISSNAIRPVSDYLPTSPLPGEEDVVGFGFECPQDPQNVLTYWFYLRLVRIQNNVVVEAQPPLIGALFHSDPGSEVTPDMLVPGWSPPGDQVFDCSNNRIAKFLRTKRHPPKDVGSGQNPLPPGNGHDHERAACGNGS